MSFVPRFFTKVNPTQIKIIERKGKYSKTAYPGIHFMIPFADSIKTTLSKVEQTLTLPKQSVYTKDNICVNVDGFISCKVVKPEVTAYRCENFLKHLEIYANSLLLRNVSKEKLDKIMEYRDEINSQLLKEIQPSADRWGIECKKFEIKNISFDENYSGTLDWEADTQRFIQTKLLNLEASKTSVAKTAEVMHAKILIEGSTDAKITYLKYKALSDEMSAFKKLLDSGVLNEDILNFKLKKDLISAYDNLADGQKTLIIKKDLDGFNSLLDDFGKKLNRMQQEAKNEAK